MKRFLLTFICLAFAKVALSQGEGSESEKSVYIDHINAPLNPLGPYDVTVEGKNLKGDVYMVGYKDYSNGQRYGTELSSDKEEATANKIWYYLEKDGLVVENKAYWSDDVFYFTYDSKNRLISEKNNDSHVTYEYDNKSRIIKKTTAYLRVNKTKERTYTYKTDGDTLVINLYFETDEGEKKRFIYRYKNGLIIEKQTWSDVDKYTYKFDHKGNWVFKDWTNRTGDPIKRTIVYRKDIDKIIADKQLSWEKRRIYDAHVETAPYLVINDQKVSGIQTSRALSNQAFFYLNDGQRYYRGNNAYSKTKGEGHKGTATLLSEGREVIFQNLDGYVKLFDKGKSISYLKYDRYGSDFYVRDTVSQKHYIIKDFVNYSKEIYYPEIIENTTSFYGRNIANETYILYINGSNPDYSRVSKSKYTESGDPIVFYDNKPILILKDYYKIKSKGLHPAIAYTNEKIFDKNPTKKAVEAFNKNQTVQLKKVDSTKANFYQNNQPIEVPNYMVFDAFNNDMIFGYGLEDFVIKDFTSMPLNSTRTARIVAKENEILTQYVDGKLKYIFNSGKMLGKDDYKIVDVGYGKWLVYFNRLNKSALLTINRDSNIDYAGYMTYVNNAWIYKRETGIVLYVNGAIKKGGTFKSYVDGKRALHININDKLAYYLSDYSSLSTGNMYALDLHSGQPYVKKNRGSVSQPKNATAFLNAKNASNPNDKRKEVLKNIEHSLNAQGLSLEKKVTVYQNLLLELYAVDREQAFEMMMLLDNKYIAKVQKGLTKQQRDFIRLRARKELSKYSGAHSNTN